jgi:DNA repair protein RecN (Recombination protein N)
MLIELNVRDVVLIERLELKFPAAASGKSLAVLTGETGAGKSILLDALGLALGSRGDSGLVRHGAAQASVAAVFDLPARHRALSILEEQGIDAGDGSLVLRRVIGSDGRGRAFVNDQPVSVGLLRQIGDTLVEIQGQFEQHGLLDPANHRDLLDGFADHAARAEAVAAAHGKWRQAETAYGEAQAALQRAQVEEDYLRHAVEELERMDPQAGEEESLASERQMLRHGAAIAEALEQAAGELEANRGVAGALRSAQRVLERNADKAAGRFDVALAALDRAAVEAEEAAAQIDAVRQAMDADPGRLDKVEERLFALRALARKHNVDIAGLAALRGKYAEQLAAIDGGAGRMSALRKAADAARKEYVAAAEVLSTSRQKAATALDKAVQGELAPLKLDKAKFLTRTDRLAEVDWGAHGMDRIAFLVSTNPGVPPGPLNKIASGGELSRFMLALKVVMSRSSDAATLVFDEVDSGIGGATAAAVAERLARLAAKRQVLVVTHSPQVAARGDRHWRIGKRTSKGQAVTEVTPLDDAGRREEIARMLAGAEITDEARAAAGRLMAAS